MRTTASTITQTRLRKSGPAEHGLPSQLCVPLKALEIFVQSETMTGVTGRFPARSGLRSYACIGMSATRTQPAQLLGALDLRKVDVWFETEQKDGALCVCVRDETDGLAPEALDLPEIFLLEGPDLAELLTEYGRLSGQIMEARSTRGSVRGWCSWYHYYGRETEEDILAQAQKLLRAGLIGPGGVILIDDGWNLPEPSAPRNWGDWEAGAKYPRGMQALVKDLNALGLKAGLWLAPFSVDARSKLASEHPDWLLTPKKSTLLEEGENPVSSLDLTHPEVLAFLDATFRRVFDEWGFEFVKLDFLMHGMAPGPRFEKGMTRASAFRRALSRIRDVAGDRFILCCGSPLGPAVGVADAMRVGFDTGSRWHAPMLTHLWPLGNCSVKPAANATLYRHWMDGAWWLNDPDCLVVRSGANDFEASQFDEKHPGGKVEPSAFGLEDEQAGFWSRLVRLSRCRMLSEDIDELAERRQVLCQFVMGGAELSSGQLMFCSDIPELVGLRASDGTWFAWFNLGDLEVTVSLPDELEEGDFRECLSGELLHLSAQDSVSMSIPACAARLWCRC